jgi:hypothetical protein
MTTDSGRRKMMTKKRRAVPAVRLSEKEKVIVQYITNQLEGVYRNGAGKPVYARNMDQVMKDLWGIKKFTKTLERARYNEGLMISLMKRLDTETLWQICRSKEHYRLLCTLVATDNYIVKLTKKYNKWAELEPVERPTNKMKKLEKEIRKAKKTYRSAIKTFQDIFDIEKAGKDEGDSILDSLNDWMDRHDSADDIFYGLDDMGMDYDSIESMDAYVAKATGRGRKKRVAPSRIGALGIFDEGEGDIFDEEDEDEFEDFDLDDEDQRALRNMTKQYYYGGRKGESNDLTQICNIIAQGFNSMNDRLSILTDLLVDDGDDEEEVEIRPSTSRRPSVQDMMDMSEQYAAEAEGQDDGRPQVVEEAPDTAE